MNRPGGRAGGRSRPPSHPPPPNRFAVDATSGPRLLDGLAAGDAAQVTYTPGADGSLIARSIQTAR